MKILMLANILSTHTIKWAKALSEIHEVLLFGLAAPDPGKREELEGLNYLSVGIKNKNTYSEHAFQKLSYLKALPELMQVIDDFKPDILHAHYATSYGLIGALSNFHPFIISVWGSDVYDFPLRSIFHKMLLKHNLGKADIILSTSKAMADQTRKFTDKNILVTPFGINLKKFCRNRNESHGKNGEIVIGTVKTLHKIYGISYLIKAFKIVVDRNPGKNLKLLIVGGGPLEKELKRLTVDLKVDDKTSFTGNIPQNKVPEYLNMLDVYVAVSLNESFGVAVIEAGACELPVVVSGVGGLVEVVENGKSGYIVPSEDSEETANAIEKLILSENTRVEFGKYARKRINELYAWEKSVEIMNSVYLNCVGNK
jgi:L-malate glycosyltransferase